jgi:hypothetical protein
MVTVTLDIVFQEYSVEASKSFQILCLVLFVFIAWNTVEQGIISFTTLQKLCKHMIIVNIYVYLLI